MTSNGLKYYYNLYNKKYFNNKLPNLWVHYGKLPRHRLGVSRFMHLCKSCEECLRIRKKYKAEIKTDRIPIKIVISDKLRSGLSANDVSLITLLHEMIHVSIGGKYQHGPRFRKEKKRLTRAGAYDRLL